MLRSAAAFAPTILVQGIRPRSTRWKVDEKVAALLSLAPWTVVVLRLVTQSKEELGGTSGKHPPPGCGKCKFPCETIFYPGCSPLVRQQFAYVASCGLAFLIGLGLYIIQVEQNSLVGEGEGSGEREGERVCVWWEGSR